jgi:hypothetical protein
MCAAAHADDSDLDVAGPSGRTSVALFVQQQKYNSNEIFRATNVAEGTETSASTYVTLSSIYALSDRVSLTAAIPWTTSDSHDFTWFGSSQTHSDVGAGGAIGMSADLVGRQADLGPMLVGRVGITKYAGNGASQTLALQPQYRFDRSLLASVGIEVRHENGVTGSQSLTANVLWHVSPEVSVVPTLRATHVNGFDSYSSYRSTLFGASLTYHPTLDWSASIAFYRGQDTDRITNLYANNIADARTSSATIGVRRSF